MDNWYAGVANGKWYPGVVTAVNGNDERTYDTICKTETGAPQQSGALACAEFIRPLKTPQSGLSLFRSWKLDARFDSVRETLCLADDASTKSGSGPSSSGGPAEKDTTHFRRLVSDAALEAASTPSVSALE